MEWLEHGAKQMGWNAVGHGNNWLSVGQNNLGMKWLTLSTFLFAWCHISDRNLETVTRLL